jgi:hypothetical protein
MPECGARYRIRCSCCATSLTALLKLENWSQAPAKNRPECENFARNRKKNREFLVTMRLSTDQRRSSPIVCIATPNRSLAGHT